MENPQSDPAEISPLFTSPEPPAEAAPTDEPLKPDDILALLSDANPAIASALTRLRNGELPEQALAEIRPTSPPAPSPAPKLGLYELLRTPDAPHAADDPADATAAVLRRPRRSVWEN